ncbi:MAG: YicC family protein [Pirellulales bacterium]|nr:YicC family protein [Pirellulales bacterium]
MTGFGETHVQQDGLSAQAEVRSINSRYLKVTVRCGEGYAALEPRIESMLRDKLRRGTISVNIRVTRTKSCEDYQIDTELLDRYHQSFRKWQENRGLDTESRLDNLLLLPGVINEELASASDLEADWPVIEKALLGAVENLTRMRSDEGRAMEADLKKNCLAAAEALDAIETRAPLVVESYRQRLHDRLTKILTEHKIELEPSDIIKEVGLFAERSDISEEVVRLRCHFEQFFSIMELPESSGRKLDFITQEMFRETNTIGSKANDVEIARNVIEIKANIERLREMIQNIE